MQHGSLRAPVRVFMAAVLLCLSFLAAPKAAAAQLQDVNGITLLSFDSQQIVSIGNQTGEGWFLTGEMLELIHTGTPNIVCTQPFACLPNHIVGKGVIKELRHQHPEANIVAIDYDPGASEVNQLNRIKLMLATAQKNLKAENA